MKKVGLLGGMSWESSIEYYRIMNQSVSARLGGSHSANCLLHSFDFHEVETLQHQGKWDELTALMVAEANNLKKAGAECIVICTNTMHLMAPDIEEATGLEVIHIADATADAILSEGIGKVLLLGTKFTMEGTFYRDRLEKRGIAVEIPEEEDRQIVHDIIYNELVKGVIRQESRDAYVRIIEKMTATGIEGVILGCTEIPLLVKQGDIRIKLFDTTDIHANAAVNWALME